MSRFETKVPPVIWWAWGALVVLLVDVSFGDSLALGWGRVVGILLLLAGVGVALMAFSGFRQAQTTFDPHNVSEASTLITDGIYKFSRNPMYVGLMLLLLGWGLWRGTIAGAILGALVFGALVTRMQIVPEERALAEKFGDEFEAFTARTRRWI